MLSYKLDNLEQYSRRNNIRIIGIKEQKDEKLESELVSLFKDKLNINIVQRDMDCFHRVGNVDSKTKASRPVIIKFATYNIKDEVLKNRKKLRGSNIFISEDLTSARYKLLRAVQDLQYELFCVSETWLNDQNKHLVDVNGFIYYHVGRVGRGGGVGIYPYLLIEDSTYSSRIASCPKLEDIHICDDVPLPLEDNCVLNLLKNEDKCAKIKVHLKETLVQQIGRGDLLVYTPDSVNIYYNCNEVVRINNDKFIFQEDLLRGEIFNLPKLDLNTYNVTNEESIQLNKVNIKVIPLLVL
ncbi:hypothetical protein QE152_g25161 [Popillia japonica]|uniref:Uncharacterized protein n=1 Tax=Popillia japonica TaxID=7064 RepID=A0AAW1K2I9_POPJA